MTNVFKTGKMMSNVVDSALTTGKAAAEMIDGALVTLGDLAPDTAYAAFGANEYDTYVIDAPAAATDRVALVDYAGRSETVIDGNTYKVTEKLVGLKVPAGGITRVRIPYVDDIFWLGEGNFSATPTVGKYATAAAGVFTHAPADTKPVSGYAVKILAEEDLNVGTRRDGKIYLVKVVQL